MKKLLTVIVILGLASGVYAANQIDFPVVSMGADQTVSFAITGNLDLANALGIQVVGITLSPVGPVTGTLTLNGFTTLGSTFDLVEGTNWGDWSNGGSLMGMTNDFQVSSVVGPLTAGFVQLTSSADASGTWDLLPSAGPLKGYLNAVGGTFGSVYAGQITVTGTVIPEPATLSLLALAGMGVVVRRRR